MVERPDQSRLLAHQHQPLKDGDEMGTIDKERRFESFFGLYIGSDIIAMDLVRTVAVNDKNVL
jgi:hypothetical protein